MALPPPENEPLIFGLIGAFITGLIGWIGIIVKHIIFKDEKKLDEATQIRTELRASNERLEKQAQALREEYDEKMEACDKKIEILRSENQVLREQLMKSEIRAQTEISALKIKINEIMVRYMTDDEKVQYQ